MIINLKRFKQGKNRGYMGMSMFGGGSMGVKNDDDVDFPLELDMSNHC